MHNMFSLEILNLHISTQIITLNLTVVNQLLHLQKQRQGMKHPIKKIKMKILRNNTKNKAITNDFINFQSLSQVKNTLWFNSVNEKS